MDLSSIYALGAALSWCLAGLFGHKPSVALGSLHFNQIRMTVSALMLLSYCVVAGVDISFMTQDLWLIVASGLIGAAVGDYFLFKTMQRMGPRRTGVLFAANAPVAALLGWIFLNEILSIKDIVAIVIGFVGIVLAVIYGKRRDLAHVWENVTPPMWLGIVFGLLTALGQAIGVLLMRPVMEGGMDPAAAGLLRTSVAAFAFLSIYPIQKINGTAPKKMLPDRSLYLSILGNGFFGMSFGMALLLKALETGAVGTVSVLAATSPLMMLPFIWIKTRLIPSLGAWIGAGLVVVCSALLVRDDIFISGDYIALLVFILFMVGTPGPANMVAMTAGANFGFRRSIPFLAGITSGKLILNLAMGIGLYQLLEQFPMALEVLKYISAAYVLYLSYVMSRAPFAASTGVLQKAPSFLQGLIVHPLNPKAWAMLTVAWFGFGPEIEGDLWRIFVISGSFFAVQVVMHSFWCYAGDKLIGLVHNEQVKAYIQQGLALLTALVVLWVVLL